MNNNIELTTENLKKVCRICLNDGDLNLWQHKLNLSEDGASNVDDLEEERTCITLHKLFRIFDGEMANLELASEMPLICATCLDELARCYRFYQTMKQAKKQIKELYNEAAQIERELRQEIEADLLDEVVEEQPAEEIIEAPPSPTPPELEPVASKVLRKPKFMLTGGVTKMLSHSNALPLLSSKTTVATVARKRTVATASNAAKRTRIIHNRIRPVCTPVEQNASLVVTKFMPSAAVPLGSEAEDMGALELLSAGNALRTMDYTVVEVRAKNLSDVIDADETALLASNYNSANEQNWSPVYKCQYCSMAFAISQYLITHVRKSHVCKFCTLAFRKTTDLHDHIRAEHRHHCCAICGKKLSSHSNLRAHIKRLHGLLLPAQVALLEYRPADQLDAEESETNELGGDALLFNEEEQEDQTAERLDEEQFEFNSDESV